MSHDAPRSVEIPRRSPPGCRLPSPSPTQSPLAETPAPPIAMKWMTEPGVVLVSSSGEVRRIPRLKVGFRPRRGQTVLRH